MAVEVEIAVYDLLAPSKLSSLFWYTGCGIYHSAIRIPALGVEYAYGGSLSLNASQSNISGVFSLPSQDDPSEVERLMQGVRFVKRLRMGVAFGQDWRTKSDDDGRMTGPDKPLPPLPKNQQESKRYSRRGREPTDSSISGTSPLLGASLSSTSIDEWGRKPASREASTNYSISPPTSSPISYFDSNNPFKERRKGSNATSEEHQDNNEEEETYNSDLQRVLQVIEDIRSSPVWRANQYHLLRRNCNDFTNELCRRLTGKNAPAWINRAAWLGQSMPCLVPQEWIEPPTADEIDLHEVALHQRRDRSARSTTSSIEGEGDEGYPPTSPLIAIPYIETKRMSLSGAGAGLEYKDVGEEDRT